MLTITTNKASYMYGSLVTISVHLGTTSTNRVVTMNAAPYAAAYALVGTATGQLRR